MENRIMRENKILLLLAICSLAMIFFLNRHAFRAEERAAQALKQASLLQKQASHAASGQQKKGVHRCKYNKDLKRYSKSLMKQVEKETKKWQFSHWDTIDHILRRRRGARSPFDIIPISTVGCPPKGMTRYGSEADGGKLVCTDNAFQEDGCTIISLGSNNQFDFEEAIVNRTKCVVHTFDCTLKQAPVFQHPNVQFHNVCVGRPVDHDMSFNTKPLSELMVELKIPRITYLKMDIEGFEWEVFRDLFFNVSPEKWPQEMSFELHFQAHTSRIVWFKRLKSVQEVSMLVTLMMERGYRLIAKESNPICEQCLEFVAFRFQCPHQ